MKKILTLFILFGFFYLFIQPLSSQEEKKSPEKELQNSLPKKTSPIYKPAGRRDPFRNLLAGKDIREKSSEKGTPQLSIDEVVLIGIVKAEGKFTAIINGPQNFPYYIKEGYKFSDGFVKAINASQLILRKLKERGVPLRKPKDIVKGF